MQIRSPLTTGHTKGGFKSAEGTAFTRVKASDLGGTGAAAVANSMEKRGARRMAVNPCGGGRAGDLAELVGIARVPKAGSVYVRPCKRSQNLQRALVKPISVIYSHNHFANKRSCVLYTINCPEGHILRPYTTSYTDNISTLMNSLTLESNTHINIHFLQ